MENSQPSNQASVNPISKPDNQGRRLLFLETLIIIGLMFLTVILNFFNILTLSVSFPNQLGFLPHLQESKKESKLDFPINPILEEVLSADTYYTLNNVKIEDVSKENGTYKFTIIIPNTGLSIRNISLLNNTRITKIEQNSATLSAITEIKDANTHLRLKYNLKTSEWTGMDIYFPSR